MVGKVWALSDSVFGKFATFCVLFHPKTTVNVSNSSNPESESAQTLPTMPPIAPCPLQGTALNVLKISKKKCQILLPRFVRGDSPSLPMLKSEISIIYFDFFNHRIFNPLSYQYYTNKLFGTTIRFFFSILSSIISLNLSIFFNNLLIFIAFVFYFISRHKLCPFLTTH